MARNRPFTFEISLSVLDHLGRHLYRSFATVLGEAISNAWDADAKNVRIYVPRNRRGFVIKDDGEGMDADDFQFKFLKVGYSKRNERRRSKLKRPYIGRKGIGKLALLSCADRVTVISRKRGGNYVGGTIDNAGLDRAITQDLSPQEYELGGLKLRSFTSYTKNHSKGTIIQFDGLKENVERSEEFLKKIIALHFRFALLDSSFKIFLNDEKITQRHLKDLISSTQFLWKIGRMTDPLIDAIETSIAGEAGKMTQSVTLKGAKGFIASVNKPANLKIYTTESRVGVDLFVNGRLRESDILKHIPTARIAPNYFYGQIHFNALDDQVDRFTSSREGIVAGDPMYEEFIARLRKVVLKIVEQWDRFRVEARDEGDPESTRLTKTQRASRSLYNATAGEYVPRAKKGRRNKVDEWVADLAKDAEFNFESYAECFVSENLVRKYIVDRKLKLSEEAKKEIKKLKVRERDSMGRGNISIKIRHRGDDLSYLSMDDLANLVDKRRDRNREASLSRDARVFKPMRDAMAHTALLTSEAKEKLTAVRKNIKARVQSLLSKRTK